MNRVRESQLIMHEPVPFAQCYTYHSSDALDAMLEPDYFVTVHLRLHPIDQLTLVQTLDEEPVAMAVALVTKSSREGVHLHPFIRETLAAPEAAPALDINATVRYSDGHWAAKFTPGNKTWRVVDGAGQKLIKGLTETAAKAVGGGHVGLIEQDGKVAVHDPESLLAA